MRIKKFELWKGNANFFQAKLFNLFIIILKNYVTRLYLKDLIILSDPHLKLI